MKLIRRENLRINGEPVPETGLLDINSTGIRRENLRINGEPVPETGLIDIITSSENSSAGIQETTYDELMNLSNRDSLKPGAFYVFDHYHRNIYKFDGGWGDYDDPTPERLVTQALSNDKLSNHVRSITFPHDEINYTFEGGSNPTGIVMKRVDKVRNITMNLDWRKSKFWNYKTSQLTNVLTGNQKDYRNIYICSPGFGVYSDVPILIDNYHSKNIHVNLLRSPLYLESSENVRIDTYSTEYEPKSFVSMNNVQINSLNINANSNVLNEVLINNVIGCVVNINNNNSGGSTTVEDLFNPTITIK